MALIHNLPFPERFLNYFPLYLGIELILGLSIINKLSGVYGILALFTGHPLEFLQWVFYLFSISCLYYYGLGLWTIMKPKVRHYAAILVIYTLDSFISVFFIFWFALQWIYNEDVKFVQSPGQDYSKSASQFYEYSWITLVTLVVIVSRFYFNWILVGFYKKLVKFNKDMREDDVELDLKSQWRISQWLYKFEMGCVDMVRRV